MILLCTTYECCSSPHKFHSDVEELVLRINEQFPLDVGLFNIFFLNHVKLRPGQALFLGPNLPHAYLSGDCMEIMATSDNVVSHGRPLVKLQVDAAIGPSWVHSQVQRRGNLVLYAGL